MSERDLSQPGGVFFIFSLSTTKKEARFRWVRGRGVMKSGLRLSAGEVESHGYTDVGKAVGFGLALNVLFTNTHSKVVLRRFFPGAQYGYYPPQTPSALAN